MDYASFEDDFGFESDSKTDRLVDKEIHIRKQNRRGRKWLTTIDNIPRELAPEILKKLKEELGCNGSIVTGDAKTDVILLQGDHGTNIKGYLQREFPTYTITLHGS